MAIGGLFAQQSYRRHAGPQRRPVAELVAKHGFYDHRSEAMAYLWAPAAPTTSPPPPTTRELVVRFFFTQLGALVEDPATGSACANLGGWHIVTGTQLPLSCSLRQGDAVARPSRLELRVDVDRHIYVTGAVTELGHGSFTL